MEVFRDLYVTATANAMAKAVEDIEQKLPEDWIRDHQAEGKTRRFGLSNRVSFCFRCDKKGGRPAAMLVLTQKDDNTFYVSNIVPTERHQLDYSEYNYILEEFYRELLKPSADPQGLNCSITDADVGLEQWVNSETAKLLETFSACANKSTGAAHPLDRERWHAFVLSAHRANSELTPSTLARWLVEVEGWSPEVANELAIEYESGREMLAYAANK